MISSKLRPFPVTNTPQGSQNHQFYFYGQPVNFVPKNLQFMTTTTKQRMTGKPSKQVEEVSNWWRKSAAAAPTHESLAAARDFNEGWGGLTAEPGAVDYLEVDAGGVPAMWAVPKGCVDDRVILSIHGGGFIGGSMYTHRKLFAHMAKAVGCRALILNYGLAPENIYPTQINECFVAYKWLLAQGIQPHHIAFAGDSAGGNLVMATMLVARDKGLPLPAAAMPMSAWLDLATTGKSVISNDGKDVLFTKEWIKDLGARYYGDGGNPMDPLVSPLYADLKGLPPIYLHVGGDELLLDDSTRLAERAEKAGVDVQLDIFPGMQHTFQMAAGRAPESDESIARYVEWVRPKLALV
jgi:acetyl esterase/lipase